MSTHALICPACSAENRVGANFCGHCGGMLPRAASGKIPAPPRPVDEEREWAATAPAQLRAPTIPAPLFAPEPPPSPAPSSLAFERTVIEPPRPVPQPPSPGASPSAATGAEKRRSRVKAAPPEAVAERALRSRGIWLWLGLLGVAVVMVVAGWHGYGARKAQGPVVADGAPEAAAPVPAASPVAAPAAAAAIERPANVAPQQMESDTPTQAPPLAMPEPAPQAGASVAKPPLPKPLASKPRKQALPAPASAPEAPAPVAAAAVVPPPPPVPVDPLSQCGDRNFIARAQCMAAQCLKPEFKAHAQCEAVRRQQRLDEEKRNPTLAN